VFIHLGNRKIISDKKIIGIFNSETLKMSKENSWILDNLNEKCKSVAVDANNNITTSMVSPFTVIKRTSIKKDYIWRRDNE